MTFRPGQGGNPAGKPKAARNKATPLVGALPDAADSDPILRDLAALDLESVEAPELDPFELERLKIQVGSND